MSSFFLKILPEARGWRFLEKPEGLELDSPEHRLIFAFLFLVLFLDFNCCFLVLSGQLLVNGTGEVGKAGKSACG